MILLLEHNILLHIQDQLYTIIVKKLFIQMKVKTTNKKSMGNMIMGFQVTLSEKS